MTEETVDTRRNELFRRMGRNLWMYQQVEAQLKGLLTASSFAVPPTNMQAAFEAHGASLSKHSMGQLVGQATASVFAKDESHQASPPKEDWLTFSVRWDAGADFADTLHQELAVLVAERNQLAHHALTHWPITCVDRMATGLEELDAQRERIVAVHQTLARIGEHMLEAAKALGDYMASPQFTAEWRRHHLETLLHDAVARAARADGWTPMSSAGHLFHEHVRKLPEDQRSAVPKLSRLLIDSGAFDVRDERTSGGGQRTLCRLKQLPAAAPAKSV